MLTSAYLFPIFPSAHSCTSPRLAHGSRARQNEITSLEGISFEYPLTSKCVNLRQTAFVELKFSLGGFFTSWATLY